MRLTPTIFCLATTGLVSLAPAQSRFDFWASGGSFAHDESNSYFNFGLRYSPRQNVDVVFRGCDGKRQALVATNFTINHGGDDHELFIGCRPPSLPKLDTGFGVALPNTPERHDAIVATCDVGWTETGSPHDSFRAGIKVVGASNPLAALTARYSFALPECPVDIFGELGAPVIGNNARSTMDGSATRTLMATVGVDWSQRNRDAGIHAGLRLTNAVGETTGMSLTPTLGNRFGIVLSVGYRF